MNLKNHIAILVAVLSSLLTDVNSQTDESLVHLYFDGTYRCSGSLVTMQNVVTAASCLINLNQVEMFVALKPAPLSEPNRGVNDVFYPDHCQQSIIPSKDICLIELDEPFHDGWGKNPIELCEGGLPVGKKMKIIEWTSQLRVPVTHEVTIVEPNNCNDNPVEKHMYCAKDDNTFCLRYAGAPGIVDRKLCAVGLSSPFAINTKLYINVSDPQNLDFVRRLIHN